MSKTAHTPGPWFVVPYGDGQDRVICLDQAGNMRIAFMAVSGSCEHKTAQKKAWAEIHANADRIVACVNACEGIADPSVVPEAIEALRWIQSLAAKCAHLPDTDGFRRAYRDIDAAAQIALAKLEGGEA